MEQASAFPLPTTSFTTGTQISTSSMPILSIWTTDLP
jgi:hypothetical protein